MTFFGYDGNVPYCSHNFRILYAPYYAIYGKRISFYLKIKLKNKNQNKTYRVLPHGIFILLSTSKLNVHAYNNTYHVLSEDVYIIIYLLLHLSPAAGLSWRRSGVFVVGLNVSILPNSVTASLRFTLELLQIIKG